MELTVRDLNNQAFISGLEKVDSSPVLQGKKALSFARAKEFIDNQRKMAEADYKRLLALHVESEAIQQPGVNGEMETATDSAGMEIRRFRVIRDDTGRIRDYVYKDRPGFYKDFEELMKKPFFIHLDLLTTKELMDCRLSPKELRALKSLCEELPPDEPYTPGDPQRGGIALR